MDQEKKERVVLDQEWLCVGLVSISGGKWGHGYLTLEEAREMAATWEASKDTMLGRTFAALQGQARIWTRPMCAGPRGSDTPGWVYRCKATWKPQEDTCAIDLGTGKPVGRFEIEEWANGLRDYARVVRDTRDAAKNAKKHWDHALSELEPLRRLYSMVSGPQKRALMLRVMEALQSSKRLDYDNERP